ncbi:M20 family metallo-hydrolase [Bacillus sp. H-16]|uniref:M20 family metallo-hydrolase n=1 Tax=Alteribacter salitolerans TaxID=2912333 RepID=UPI001962C92B|nr:M20 family metallo-hydrolase [Alteribacter salitolerans]MBM7097498.1 M20 family metallo-hydrolase [Alteribacter salitolerans]
MKQWLEETLMKLNLVETMDQPDGFTRLGYTEEEWEAMAVFTKTAEALGLSVRQDKAGNRIARWETDENKHKPTVATGSHVDTVERGGGYDGVAGVLCGLGAVKELKDEGFSPNQPIEVICFASEESSRFGISTIGSKAMSGLADYRALENVTDSGGMTIREAVESRGLVWGDVKKAERAPDEIASFVELHIEQGLRVEQAGADYGAVTAIACPIRLLLHFNGKAGHTGTTPMMGRQDALVAAAPLISFISERAGKLSAESDLPIVATASTIELKPNVMTVIPGSLDLGIDIRSVDDSLKEQLERDIYDKCKELEKHFNVTIEGEKLVHNPSVHLNEHVCEKLVSVGSELGISSLTLESGAGHDVMNMAAKWPSGMIFIPCKGGLSHHPAEEASVEDLAKGVKIIAAYLRKETGE